MSRVVPNKAKAFSKQEAPNHAPNAHPFEDGDAVFDHGIGGEGFRTKPKAEKEDDEAVAKVAQNEAVDHREGEHQEEGRVKRPVGRATDQSDHEFKGAGDRVVFQCNGGVGSA